MLPLRGAEFFSVKTGPHRNGIADFAQARRSLPGDGLEPLGPGIALYRQTLRHGRSLREHAVKLRILPACRKMDEDVAIPIGIDDAQSACETVTRRG
jgi:hypothetical protein